MALVALALVPLMWAFALLTPRRAAPLRFWGGLLLRTLILVALVLALAGAQLVQPVRTLTTVFLLDASDSIAPAQRERAIQYVDRALAGLPPGDRAAVVAFGAGALVERAPASLAALGRINSVPVTTRTNIQEAIQLGVALLPADSQKRLVLLSDGGENSGRAADAAQLARACDGTILVARANSTRVGALRQARTQLLQGGARLLGVVLNGVATPRGKQQSYYYYYSNEQDRARRRFGLFGRSGSRRGANKN
ncbi:hypothetical protein SE17_31705, partial [Kouleothrix aurantiaca]